MSIFGNRLKELREQTGEKQADVGNLIEMLLASPDTPHQLQTNKNQVFQGFWYT